MEVIQFPKSPQEKPPFEEVYQRHYKEAVYYARGKMGNLHDAEDLVSDAFIYCYEHYDGYDPARSSVATWLYLVVNSRIKNYYRDQKQTVDYSELEEWMFVEEPDMERAVYLDELRAFISDHLAELSEQQRNVVLMRYFHDMEFADIARELDISPGNARVILSRALGKLEKSLNNTGTDWRMS